MWCASGVDSYGLRIRVWEGWFRAPGGLPSGGLLMRVPLLGLSGYPLGRVSVWKVWVTKGTLGEGWVSFGSLSGATGCSSGDSWGGVGCPPGRISAPEVLGSLAGALGFFGIRNAYHSMSSGECSCECELCLRHCFQVHCFRQHCYQVHWSLSCWFRPALLSSPMEPVVPASIVIAS